jgi:Hsp20/alpha crystallin family protein
LFRFPDPEVPAMAGRLDALDDPDYPAFTTGRAAEVLGVRQAFLRSLDADSISADYAAGVLTLTIPVREAAKPRSIQVTSSDTTQAVTA